jgi:hypothetical protein
VPWLQLLLLLAESKCGFPKSPTVDLPAEFRTRDLLEYGVGLLTTTIRGTICHLSILLFASAYAWHVYCLRLLKLAGWVRLSPLGRSATNWSIVPTPDDRWWWMWSSWWNKNWQGKPKYSVKTCPSAILSIINPIWLDLGSPCDYMWSTVQVCVHVHTQSVGL